MRWKTSWTYPGALCTLAATFLGRTSSQLLITSIGLNFSFTSSLEITLFPLFPSIIKVISSPIKVKDCSVHHESNKWVSTELHFRCESKGIFSPLVIVHGEGGLCAMYECCSISGQKQPENKNIRSKSSRGFSLQPTYLFLSRKKERKKSRLQND